MNKGTVSPRPVPVWRVVNKCILFSVSCCWRKEDILALRPSLVPGSQLPHPLQMNLGKQGPGSFLHSQVPEISPLLVQPRPGGVTWVTMTKLKNQCLGSALGEVYVLSGLVHTTKHS